MHVFWYKKIGQREILASLHSLILLSSRKYLMIILRFISKDSF